MKKIVLSVIIFFFTFQIYSQNTFHLIASVDRYSNIAEGCKKDFENIKKDFENIAKSVGLNFKVYDIEFNTEKSRKFIEDFECDETDVVFFYYTGHGYRYSDQNKVWPYLSICKNYEEECGLSLSWVHKQLVEKSPKISIAIGDCCNSRVDVTEPKLVLAQSRSVNRSASGYKSLFSEADVHIVASGSLPGQVSYGTDLGGYYTNSFLDVLKKSQNVKDLTWKYVMDKSKKLVTTNSNKEQEPHFMIKRGLNAVYSEEKIPEEEDTSINWVDNDKWEDDNIVLEGEYSEAEDIEEYLYDIALIMVTGLIMDDGNISVTERENLHTFFQSIFDELDYDNNTGQLFLEYLGKDVDDCTQEELEQWLIDAIDFVHEEWTDEEASSIYESIEVIVDNPESQDFKNYMEVIKSKENTRP